MEIIEIKNIRENPNVDVIVESSPIADIEWAEKMLDKKIPLVLHNWMTGLGCISIIRYDIITTPQITILGVTNDPWSDIVLFNNNENPSLPKNALVFGWEFNGKDDIYYAIDDKDGSILGNVNHFAVPIIKNKEE